MDDLDTALKRLLNKYLKIFRRLIRFKSLYSNRDEAEKTVDYLSSVLHDIGFSTKILESEGSPAVYAEIGEGRKTILFYNHYDVQPPDPIDEWRHPPFDLTIEGDNLYGRGVADNKGNIIARMLATELYQMKQGSGIKIKWLIEGEEEAGSPNLHNIVMENKALLMADAGIWETGYVRADGRLWFPLGYKGMIYLEIELPLLNNDAHSGYAPIIPNPAISAADLITKLKSIDGEILFKDLYNDIDDEYLTIARSMVPTDTTNLDKLKELLGIEKFLGSLSGREAYIRIFTEPSLNISGISSGYIGEGPKTIVPKDAKIKIDIRPLPGQDPMKIYRDFIRYLDNIGYGWARVKPYSMYPAGYTKPDEEIIKISIEASKKAYGVEALVTPISGGSGPIYLFTDLLKIPMSGAGVGYYASNIHAPNENIRMVDFINGVKHVYHILEYFSENP